MNKSIGAFLFVLFFIVSPAVFCQNNTESTTFIIIRHAESAHIPGEKDPSLSEEGLKRAEKLSTILQEAGIAELYSTAYKRTTQTLTPLSEKLGISINNYQPFDYPMLKKLAEENPGKKFLIAGHSNTVPAMLNYLTGSDEYKDLKEDEFNNLFIVTINKVDNASVLRLIY